jgi:hypothetical protein
MASPTSSPEPSDSRTREPLLLESEDDSEPGKHGLCYSGLENDCPIFLEPQHDFAMGETTPPPEQSGLKKREPLFLPASSDEDGKHTLYYAGLENDSPIFLEPQHNFATEETIPPLDLKYDFGIYKTSSPDSEQKDNLGNIGMRATLCPDPEPKHHFGMRASSLLDPEPGHDIGDLEPGCNFSKHVPPSPDPEPKHHFGMRASSSPGTGTRVPHSPDPEPKHHFGMRAPSSPGPGMRVLPSPDPECKHHFGMRAPSSPGSGMRVPPSPEPGRKHHFGMRAPSSPGPGMRVLPSPDPERKHHFGMRAPSSPGSGMRVPPSPEPGRKHHFGMRESSPNREQKHDFSMRIPLTPDPEQKNRIDTCVTLSPPRVLAVSEEGPSQIGTHQPTEAEQPLGSSSIERGASHTTRS